MTKDLICRKPWKKKKVRINKCGKSAGYKINTQKQVAFQYNNNEQSEKEIMNTISFTVAWK